MNSAYKLKIAATIKRAPKIVAFANVFVLGWKIWDMGVASFIFRNKRME